MATLVAAPALPTHEHARAALQLRHLPPPFEFRTDHPLQLFALPALAFAQIGGGDPVGDDTAVPGLPQAPDAAPTATSAADDVGAPAATADAKKPTEKKPEAEKAAVKTNDAKKE